MLDDRRRRLVELEHDARGGVEIEQVRVRELLALQHCASPRPPADSSAYQRRLLMRVLAVAQIAHLAQVERAAHGGQQTALAPTR